MLVQAEKRTAFWSSKSAEVEKNVLLWNDIMQVLVSVDRHGSLKDQATPWGQWLEEGLGKPIPDLPQALVNEPSVSFSEALVEITKKLGSLQEVLKTSQRKEAAVGQRAVQRKEAFEKKQSRDLAKIEEFKQDSGKATKEKQKILGLRNGGGWGWVHVYVNGWQ